MNLRETFTRAEKRKERAERAASRILDALERNGTPSEADLKAAGACRSCYGYGYYYESEEQSSDDERTTCKSCGGSGHPKTKK